MRLRLVGWVLVLSLVLLLPLIELARRNMAAAAPLAPRATQTVLLPLLSTSCTTVALARDGGFEAGLPNPYWNSYSNMGSSVLDNSPQPAAHTGNWKAWLGGNVLAVESLTQTMTVPASAIRLNVSYWWMVDTLENTNIPVDTLDSQIRNSTGTVLQTLDILSNVNAGTVWQQSAFTLTNLYAGQTIQIAFASRNDATNPTNFFIDDVSVSAACGP